MHYFIIFFTIVIYLKHLMIAFAMDGFYYLKGTLEEELNFDLRDFLPEECGLSAAINIPSAAQVVHKCLALQEHRGEKGTGILSVDNSGRINIKKSRKSVLESFTDMDFDKYLPGNFASGHNRYATVGDPGSILNIQPLLFNKTRFGPFAVAHNGTFNNVQSIKDELISEGAIFQSDTDSEIFGHLIARSSKDTLEEAIQEAAEKIRTAYSLVITTPDKIIALKDKYGVRPLSIAKLDDGFLVCSENYVYDQFPNCSFIRAINAGEMVIFKRNEPGFKSIPYTEPNEHYCDFEIIYFGNPRTRYRGVYHEDSRKALGQQVGIENPDLEGDLIVPILDSGKHHGIGLSIQIGIPYEEAFLRIHHSLKSQRRSFTEPDPLERILAAYGKLHLRKDKIKGKRIIGVDDSIVRGTTQRVINQRLREAGATQITTVIASPPIINVCPNGMDYQNRSELIAYTKSLQEVCDYILSDRLVYLSLDGLNTVSSNLTGHNKCNGCFGGRYPINP